MERKLTIVTILTAILVLIGFLMVDESNAKRVLVKLWETCQYNVQSDDYLRTRLMVMSSPDLHENIIFAEIGLNSDSAPVLTTIYIDRDKNGVVEIVVSISNSSNLIQMLADTNGDGNYDSISLVSFGDRGREELVEAGRFYGQCQVLNIEKFQNSKWESGVSQIADELNPQDLLGCACIDKDCSSAFKVRGARDSFGRPNVYSIEIVIDGLTHSWFFHKLME